MKNLFAILLTLASFDSALAGTFYVKDNYGNQIDTKTLPKSRVQKFEENYSFDAFENLGPVERTYFLRVLLMESVNPDSKLEYSKKMNAQNVLSQYFNTLPEKEYKEIAHNAMWMSIVIGNEGLVKNLGKRFLPIYPAERTAELCALARNTVNLGGTPSGKAKTSHFFEAPDESLAAFASLVESSTSLTDEKCKFSKSDEEPLSIKQLAQAINKKLKKQDAVVAPVKASIPEARKTACTPDEIRSIFIDATEKIKQNGPKHKVFLAIGTMSCPVYGLVTQGPDQQYRYYPNANKEDIVPPVVFANAQDIASRLGRKEEPPAPVVMEHSEKAIFSPFGKR